MTHRRLQRSTPAQAAQAFLAWLYRDAPRGFLEFRALLQDGRVWRAYTPAPSSRYAIPAHLEGRANVYYGVCVRGERRGTRDAVLWAPALWADCDAGLPRPWPKDVPVPSAAIRTSPGKYQLYWRLQGGAHDLDRVEDLNLRLAQALGADPAATDRARVLRLPGFRNAKYSPAPRALVVRHYPGRIYVLEDFAPLPPAPRRGVPRGAGSEGGGRFDHGRGWEDAPLSLVWAVAERLRARGYRTAGDGRLTGPCPLHECHCDHGFYFSPTSGRWWCFCRHHVRDDYTRPASGRVNEVARALGVSGGAMEVRT